MMHGSFLAKSKRNAVIEVLIFTCTVPGFCRLTDTGRSR
jgi:hypothetical protein